MRRVVLVAITFYFSIIANAMCQSIIISPSTGATYNFGDEIILSGKISLDRDVENAKVEFIAKSEEMNEEIGIATRYYSFVKDNPVTFSQINKGTLIWEIPPYTKESDDWRIIVEVYDGSELVLRMSSEKFEISSKLDVVVSVDKLHMNLGDTLEIVGTVTDLRGNPVSGMADITIKEEDGGTVHFNSVEFENGYIFYSYKFDADDPPGEYTVSVDVQDKYKNRGSAESTEVEVSGRLDMSCELSSDTIDPGSTITIYGRLVDIEGNPEEGVNVSALLEDPSGTKIRRTETTDYNGKFSITFNVEKHGIPGNYVISVDAEDESGNRGSCSRKFAVPEVKKTSTTFSLDREWYYQDENLSATLSIENLGNVDLNGTFEIYIDGLLKLSDGFSVGKGQIYSNRVDIGAIQEIGNHTINVVVRSGDEILAETLPTVFSVSKRPLYKKEIGIDRKMAILLMLLLLGVLFLFWSEREIREYIRFKARKRK